MSRRGGRLGRLMALGGLGSQVSGSYLGERIGGLLKSRERREEDLEKLHLRNAQRVVRTMGRLKGAAMKMGQGLAQMASSLELPAEVQGVLDQLHDRVEPVPFPEVKRVIERSLDGRLEELFASFDEAPIGTASLGQVHRARLPDGQPVVVKVLHDGIEDAVAADMAALRLGLRSSRLLRRSKAEINAWFDEFQARINEELDYLQEAANLVEFGRLFAEDPDFRVPRCFPSHSSEQVLCMEELPGRHIDEFLVQASPEARRRACLNLVELYYRSTFRHRVLHADPHPGNYLFEDDGRIGILDLGCVKRFDPWWVARYAKMAGCGIRGEREACIEAARGLGVYEGDSRAAEEVLWDYATVLARPFHGSYEVGGPDDDLMQRLSRIAPRLMLHKELKAPSDLLFMHRTLAGIYTLGRRFRVEASWWERVEPHCQFALEQVQL